MKHQEDQMALAQKKAAREEEAYQRDSEILFSNDIAAQGEKAGKANISNHVLEQAKALGLAKEIKTPDGKVMYGYARRDLKEVLSTLPKGAVFYYDYLDKKQAYDAVQEAVGKGKATPDDLTQAAKAATTSKNAWLMSQGKDPDASDAKLDALERKIESNEKIAGIRSESAAEVAKIRAEAAAEVAKERGDKSAEGKDLQKRKAVHREIEKIFGLSDFIEKIKEPEIRQNYSEVTALSDDISRSPAGYGLNKNAGEAEIAKKAYDIWAMMKGKPQSKTEKPSLGSFERKP